MISLRASLRTWHLAGALLLAMPQAASAQAPQPWPERTIQAIVPFAAGAANEVLPLTKIAGHVIERLRSTSGLSLNRV